MKFTTYAQTLNDLNHIKASGLVEVILGHRDFSRFGKLDVKSFKDMSVRARELGLRVIFEWDILMTENTFSKLVNELAQYSDHFDVVRVQDPGAFEWVLKKTDFPLQYIAENGNHNLPGLLGWCTYAGKRLERIVLSIELPKDKIEEYCKTLPVSCEILGMGRILLFYTPRLLLSPLASEQLILNQDLSAVGESEESPHKGFPIVENIHGTFMFHIKDFCILSESQELSISHLRVDLRWNDISLLKFCNEGKFEELKVGYKQDLMRGFYHVNKTDVLFPKLKNHRLQKREGNYIGEVLEAEKASHLAIQINHPNGLKKGQRLRVVHPKGEEFEITVHMLKNLALEEVDLVPAGKTAIIQFSSGVWVKSQVFYVSP